MKISASIRKLTLVFVALFIGLSGVVVYWQVVVAQQVTSNPHNGRRCMADAAPIRGRIFDRNGVLLADSELSTKGGCGYVRHYFLNDYPSLAGLIGYYISPEFTSSGIEKQYDDYLSGRKGLTELTNTVDQVLHRPPVGDDIYLTIDTRIQKIVDHDFDIQATQIDHEETFPTNKGSVIVSDPHTGQILAMLSRPTFDSNRIASGDLDYFNQVASDPAQPLLERPIDDCYVPGSTYKTMTLLAALDSGKASLSDPFYNDHNPDHKQAIGPVVIGSGDQQETFGKAGNNIDTYTRTFPVSLNYGFSHSDNVIFAQVGAEDVGADTWLDYNHRFYVGKQIPFDLPVKVSTVTPQDLQHRCSFTPPTETPLGMNTLAENAFGQGVNFVTPMQMTMIDNGIANNGTLMRPSVVMKIVQPNKPGTPTSITADNDGTVVLSNDPQELGTPIQQQTAQQVRDAMYGVARCGSGRFPPIPGAADPVLWQSPWSIIVKTGTGEIGGGKPAESWLLSQAPYQNPALTIVAMKENGGEGGPTNGPMVTQMYNDIFGNVMKIQQPPPPDGLEYCTTHGLLQ